MGMFNSYVKLPEGHEKILSIGWEDHGSMVNVPSLPIHIYCFFGKVKGGTREVVGWLGYMIWLLYVVCYKWKNMGRVSMVGDDGGIVPKNICGKAREETTDHHRPNSTFVASTSRRAKAAKVPSMDV